IRHSNPNVFGWVNTRIMSNTLNKFRFRHWKGIYLNAYIRRMFSPYRIAVKRLANAYLNKSMPDSADKWLKWGHKHIPFYPNLRYTNRPSAGSAGPSVRYAYSFAQALHKPGIWKVHWRWSKRAVKQDS